MRKMLRAGVLVIAIACTVQAGEMQNPVSSQAPDIGTELLVLLSFLF
jgi:hypothetical protein